MEVNFDFQAASPEEHLVVRPIWTLLETNMKKAIVVGSGAGGATIAKELQGKFQVTVLEAGGQFRPFSRDLKPIETIKKTHLLFDEREISWLFPNMKVHHASRGMVLVNGLGYGGTTTLSAGNAIRCDQDLKAVGIDLDQEFEELYKEIPVSIDHKKHWHTLTREVFGICQNMNLQPHPTPKMVRFNQCIGCGRCVLGCQRQAKWDSRIFLENAVEKGAKLVSNCIVKKVIIENGRVTGVIAGNQIFTKFYQADLVVLAAGGLKTPVILKQSGIACLSNLFVDPVLCVATRWNDSLQNRELPMPFVVQQKHYIISPYFDFLSFFFNQRWKYPAGDIFSLMIKLADSNVGNVTRKRISKQLSDEDKIHLREALNLCSEIFSKLGIKRENLFLGTVNAGHPGGMFSLTEKENDTLHNESLPPNLYVADASLLPKSLGNPAILTIAALAKKISKYCAEFA
jgi:hypothetical protein